MTKATGLGDNFYLAGYDLSADVGSLSRIGGGPNALQITAINKSAFERAGGVRDGAIELSSWFDPAALAEHAALSTLLTTDQIATYGRGTALGDAAASVVGKQVNYDGTRGTDGSLAFGVQNLSNGFGLEWGDQITAGRRTDTGATAGTGVSTASGTTNFGLQAYLHVFAFTGTDITIKLQESSDDGADTYADVVGGGFTQVTTGQAPKAQRIATATNLAVERYLKVTTVTTGGFVSASFAVMVVRNLVAAPAF